MSRIEHVALVGEGQAKFNAWRNLHPDDVLDLSGEDLGALGDLDGFQLGPVDLSHCTAVGVSFVECQLTLAVMDDARGEGLARTVWRRFTKTCPRFFWRSRTENPFNAFYYDAADGFVKRGKWTVFWHGETDMNAIAEIVERIDAMPASFEGE